MAYPSGTGVQTLCGYRLAADNSELAWLWETCAECGAVAKRLAAASR